MRLTFKSSHQSLRALPETELPAFTLITGVNGAGKSHLLRAIQNKAVEVDIAPAAEDVRLFDWTNMVPNDAAPTSTVELYQQREQLLAWAQEARAAHAPRINALFSQHGIADKVQGDFWAIARDPDELDRIVPDAALRRVIKKELETLATEVGSVLLHHTRNDSESKHILSGLGARGRTPGLLVESDFRGRELSWGRVDMFQQSLARLFFAYFELQRINALNRLTLNDGGTPHVHPLSGADFVSRHGLPPWDFVNRVLNDARLPFSVDHPTDYTASKYLPVLRKTTSGAVTRSRRCPPERRS